MDKPIALDLYCCAGGAARGYQASGFHVIGVDKVDRSNYCGDLFWQSDAIHFLNLLLHAEGKIRLETGELVRPKLIHASPPCQAGSPLVQGTNASMGWGRTHEQLIPETRRLLDLVGIPYVIEQPVGAKLPDGTKAIRRDLMLCMDMFPIGEPPWVQRHREFELFGFTVEQPKHPKHKGYVRGMRHSVYRDGPYVAAYGDGGGKATEAEMQHALGIDWTDVREELTEAIPPAYTLYVGAEFRRHSGQ